MSKRTYKQATMAARDGAFAVDLDEKPLRTPAGAVLALPSAGLAEAIAGEWAAQGETIKPDTMPLTRLACTAIDRVGPARADIVAELAGYGRSDLLCHRAEAGSELAARQQAGWQPQLDWLAETFSVRLAVGEGIMPIPEPEGVLDALKGVVEAVGDDMALGALADMTTLLGSVVLALGVRHGHLDAGDAWALAHVDETYQEEQWGQDAEAAQRRADRHGEYAAAVRFLALLGA